MAFYRCGGGSKITKANKIEDISYGSIYKDTYTFATVPGHNYLITLIGLDRKVVMDFNFTGANVVWDEKNHLTPMANDGITDYAAVIVATSSIVTLKTTSVIQYATFRATELV